MSNDASAADPRVLEARFQAIAETLRAVPWEADPATDTITYVGPQIKELTGYAVEQWTGGRWRDAIHPEDRDEVIRRYEYHLQRRLNHNLEYRLVTASGTHTWFRDIIAFVTGPDGRELVRGLMIVIDEEKALERALRESEARYRQAERIAGLVHWTCTPSTTDRWQDSELVFSEQASALFGLPVDRLRMSMADYIDCVVHEADRSSMYDEMERAVMTNRAELTLEYRIQRSDGTVAYVVEMVHDSYDNTGRLLSSFGVIQDVTERKRTELALKESSARYRKAERIAKSVHWSLEISPDDRWESNVVTFSEAALEILGVDSEHRRLTNADFMERLIFAGDRELVREALLGGVARKESDFSVTYRISRPDGSVRWVVEHIENEFDEAGRRTFAFGTIQDVTDQKEKEKELHEAYLKADLASRSKTQFLATMSHELRTPLNAIIGFSEIMKSEMMGPIGTQTYKGYIGDVHSSGTYLLSIINELLDLSLIDSGETKLEESIMQPDQLVSGCVSLLRGKATDRRVRLDWHVQPDCPRLRVDARRIKQALLNLISNAIKFTPSGGIVKVDVTWSAVGIALSVSDTGIGMAAADVDRVVRPFVQLENWLIRKHEGVGLGLPIAKAFCELHGGSLSLESELGKGTVVRILLPQDRMAAGV
jgi:PAS domain S-box-containing protein